MKNLVIFGSIPLVVDIIKIIKKKDINLLGVCCEELSNSWRDVNKGAYNYCKDNNIPILTHEDILELNPDIGFSIRYNKLIKKNVIDKFSIGIFNTHGGILPEYRGTYSNIHALINGESEYGVTLHYIDEGVDTGDIVDIKKIKINNNDTGLDLYKKGEELCKLIVEDNIDSIINNTCNRISQEELIKQGKETNEYKMNAINDIKYIELKDINSDKSLRVIRAFDSPYHEPAYTFINGEKVYLRYKY